MIISESRKFIFAAVPKTGTHSIRRALRPHMSDEDIEQVRLFEEKKFPIPELANLRHGHISLAQLRPFLEPAKFESFFKFAFVRNPFDRFVSYCAFMTRKGGEFEKDPKRMMWYILRDPGPRSHILFQPQCSFIVDSGGKPLTDYIGRVEQMQGSFDEVCDRIGIPRTELEKTNESKRDDYRQYYDDALIEGVAKLYARDLELFGYEF
jgi:hypothetical protein